MGAGEIISIAAIVLIVGGAILYIIKAKKSGRKCIGCPSGGTCNGCCSKCGEAQNDVASDCDCKENQEN
ncbi:MAG: FeoB-associated Cys-rich membrane protein [Clostridia bacterium]|nr:FeoB-associated Cys-rich membrane protein [Clostridia bacterium]